MIPLSRPRSIIDRLLEGDLPIQQAMRTLIRRRRGGYPKIVEKYIDAEVKATGLPRDTVEKSGPVRRFIKSLYE